MNDLLLLLTAILCTAAVLFTWKLGRSRLYGLILVFLILIATVGGKVAIFFGHETNTGNIFYAAAYLATYFLLERYGRRAGFRVIWIGALGVSFFATLTYLTVSLTGSAETSTFNTALFTTFAPVPRIAFASVLAYVLSQNLNIRLYCHLKEHIHGLNKWGRANIANALAQMLDSAVFFSIAFAGVVPSRAVGGIIFTGLALKIVYMMLAAPFLYLNTIEEGEDEDGNSLLTIG